MGLDEMEVYIGRSQNKVEKLILTRTIRYLILEIEQRPGVSVANKWCYHSGLWFTGYWGDKDTEEEGTAELDGSDD